jgi:hypothetical protein
MKTISDTTAAICQAALAQVQRDAERHAAEAARLGQSVEKWRELQDQIKTAADELAAA